MSGLLNFTKISRAKFSCNKSMVRSVYVSELVSQSGSKDNLDDYIADKAPLYYRDLSSIYDSLNDGYFLTTIKETLRKLPTSDSFRESHFGEIAACIFTEEVMGLRRLYSKLSLLTSENANAYKMDLVLYNPNVEPLEFVFCEVKSSPKSSIDGLPAGHDKSCFADIFNSLNGYVDRDLEFDLAAAKDRISGLPEQDRAKVREALKPYSNAKVKYAGIAVIDSSTQDTNETTLLATRKNKKEFDVDLLCIEAYPTTAQSVYERLEALSVLCSRKKN